MPPPPKLRIEMTSPTNGASLEGPRVGQAVRVAARVTQSIGIVCRTIAMSYTVEQDGEICGPFELIQEAWLGFPRPGPAIVRCSAAAEAMGGQGEVEAADVANVSVLDNPPLTMMVEQPLLIEPTDGVIPAVGRDTPFSVRVLEAQYVQRVELSIFRQDGTIFVQQLQLPRRGDEPVWEITQFLPKDVLRSYRAEFRCFDFFGRSTGQEIRRDWDDTAPTIKIMKPDDPEYAVGESVPVEVEVADPNLDPASGLASVQWRLDSQPWAELDTSGQYEFSLDGFGSVGSHTVEFHARDRQGNESTVNRDFFIGTGLLPRT